MFEGPHDVLLKKTSLRSAASKGSVFWVVFRRHVGTRVSSQQGITQLVGRRHAAITKQ